MNQPTSTAHVTCHCYLCENPPLRKLCHRCRPGRHVVSTQALALASGTHAVAVMVFLCLHGDFGGSGGRPVQRRMDRAARIALAVLVVPLVAFLCFIFIVFIH